MKKLKVLLIFDSPYHTPRGYNFKKEFEDLDWMTEDDVNEALLKCGHEVRLLGIYNNIDLLSEEIRENRPDIIFNLADVFKQKTHFDKNIAALLELLEIPFTGGSSETLAICGDKALSKKILSFHRIKVPHFHTFYRNHRIWLPKKMKLPRSDILKEDIYIFVKLKLFFHLFIIIYLIIISIKKTSLIKFSLWLKL